MKSNQILSSISFLIACATIISCAKKETTYFGETPPGKTPAIFAPGVISTKDDFEFGAIFSKDLTEFYYGVFKDGKAETRMMKVEDGSWSEPKPILIHDVYSYNDPFLTPDESKLFFISDQPLDGQTSKKDYDIWYIERQSGGWSAPVNAGKNINSGKNEYYISFTSKGKMYFASNVADSLEKENYDIYSSERVADEFQPSIQLDTAINSPYYEADVFVAPDESYLVFSAKRPDNLGSGDLYVSFRNPDNTWTIAQSLGNTINTETDDFCPYVSPDGKYLFYASRDDVYWVSTEVITALRPVVQ
ncbi:PD40 domain-containing protein [Fulvivirgaceae bacterium PWU4]|uniref:PD40 domain-containing protein n=1 Tax=Chryseosolibacter histidini TaxID=2782349 RepID=A0AAP2DRE8_9BACT|nr:hypothetical protein [Chryseosolibacter histidini]MBT1700129.1 PD40 domain-containing protein [Chryseosolibacter histidini]